MPSLGSSPARRSTGGPSSRSPIRSLSGATVYVAGRGRPRLRSLIQSARGPGRAAAPASRGRTTTTAGGAGPRTGAPTASTSVPDPGRAHPGEGVGRPRARARGDVDATGDGDVGPHPGAGGPQPRPRPRTHRDRLAVGDRAAVDGHGAHRAVTAIVTARRVRRSTRPGRLQHRVVGFAADEPRGEGGSSRGPARPPGPPRGGPSRSARGPGASISGPASSDLECSRAYLERTRVPGASSAGSSRAGSHSGTSVRADHEPAAGRRRRVDAAPRSASPTEPGSTRARGWSSRGTAQVLGGARRGRRSPARTRRTRR